MKFFDDARMRRCYSERMKPPNSAEINNAARIIRDGGLVAMPTETVYGLAADATNNAAVARIFDAKGRPQFNPLIIHVASIEMAKRYAEFSPVAEKLAQAFWPGPLTLVLPRKVSSPLIPAQAGIQKHAMGPRFRGEERDIDVPTPISFLVSAGLDTIGVRMPNHPLAQSLIAAVGRPLAAPSANHSGSISPTRAAHVKDSLGDKVDMILDGGACPVGVESTIVKVEGDKVILLRPGGIVRAEIESVIGKQLESATGGIEAPGMMASHYAPNVSMRLNAHEQHDSEAFLGFGQIAATGGTALNLSVSGDITEAAANLFAHLRALDALCVERSLTTIAVAQIPMQGLGEAINDRLSRAAAPRI